jgi:hypothetical protein
MTIFSLTKGKSPEIQIFPHLIEFFRKKIQQVQPSSMPLKESHGLKIMFVLEGKFEWSIDNQSITVYPNDAVLVFPKQNFGGLKEMWDVGVVVSITISPRFFSEDGELILGEWSGISETEQRLIGKLFSLNKKPIIQNFKQLGEVLQKIENELFINELGFKTRINHLLDELLIIAARQLSKQDNQRRDFPQSFQKLDQILRENLAHPWTVEEMAVIMGLGTTAFTEKVKSYSGFSPLNYLINLRSHSHAKIINNKFDRYCSRHWFLFITTFFNNI